MPHERLDNVHRDLDTVRCVVREFVATADAQLFLFGSRARGNAGPHSDIDIAILPEHPLPPGLLARVRAAFEVGLLDETETRQALAMADDRNLGVHTYNESLANEIAERLSGHATLLRAWVTRMAAHVASMP